MCFHSYILRHSKEVQRLFFPTDLNAERTRNLKSNLTQFTFLIPVSVYNWELFIGVFYSGLKNSVLVIFHNSHGHRNDFAFDR